jgi:ketosteroid isomerase-like protein
LIQLFFATGQLASTPELQPTLLPFAKEESMDITPIETLEEKLRHAMLTSNVARLDELIADDLVWTMHTGFVGNKQHDLEAHRSGLFQFTKIEINDRQIHPYSADCVVVTLEAELTGVLDKQAFSDRYRFTRVWLQRQNRWQVIAGHVSQLALP